MPQFITDYTNAIDWVNLTATLLVGAILGWSAKRFTGWWSWWSETTRSAVKFAFKEQAERQYRDIVSYRLDTNLLMFYITKKLMVILVLCVLLIVTVEFMILLTAEDGARIGFDEIVVQDRTALVVIYVGTVAIYFSAIGGSMSELWQTGMFYRKFEDFKKRVSLTLSHEEMAAIEKSVKSMYEKKL